MPFAQGPAGCLKTELGRSKMYLRETKQFFTTEVARNRLQLRAKVLAMLNLLVLILTEWMGLGFLTTLFNYIAYTVSDDRKNVNNE
jgi:hypothetical protein